MSQETITKPIVLDETMVSQNAILTNSLKTIADTIKDKVGTTSLQADNSDAWNSSKAYAVGDTCIYDSKVWECLVGNTNKIPTTNTTEWKQITLSSLNSSLNKTWTLKKSCSANGSFTVDLNGCTEVLLVNRWSNLERFYANSSVAPLIVGAKYFIDGKTVNENQNDKMNITINSLSQITVDGVSTSKSTEYNVNLYAR